MRCPECGNENTEDAEFCSLCYAGLKGRKGPATTSVRRAPGEATGKEGGYQSPSEWRGELVKAEISPEDEVGRRIRNFKIRNLIFAFFVVAIIVAVVLMLTVWGNPSPQKVLKSYLTAITAGNEAQALEWMLPGDAALNTQSVDAAIAEAQGVKVEDLKIKVTRTDQDTTKAILTGGWITPANGGERHQITEGDNLSFTLHMSKGRWYMDPQSEIVIRSL